MGSVTGSRSGSSGGMQVSLPGLNEWYKALKNIKGRRLKVVWIGDSISAFNTLDLGFSAPWLVQQRFQRFYDGGTETLGTRFVNPNTTADVPSVDSISGGTASGLGAGGYSCALNDGGEIVVSGTMDSIRVLYGTSEYGGSINIYDGGSDGAVVASVSTAGEETFSNILEHTFAGAPKARSVTIKASGGSSTLIEQVVPINRLLSSNFGLDMVTCAHAGWKTAHFVEDDYEGAAMDAGSPQTHALSLIGNFSPDLIINCAGYNDSSVLAYKQDQMSLYGSILDRSPEATILTVVPYNGIGNGKSGMEDAALDVARSISLSRGTRNIEVVSYKTTMGTVHKDSLDYYTWDGAHPTAEGKLIQAELVYASLSGDFLGTAIGSSVAVARTPEIGWVGRVSGDLDGKVLVSSATVITESRNLDRSDWGGVLEYTGSSDITLTLPLDVAYRGITTSPYARTTIVVGGTGKVSLAGETPVSMVGETTTTGAMQRIEIMYSGSGGAFLCSRIGG